MTLLPLLTDAEMASFEDECFADWLNLLDARLDYDIRRLTPLKTWRECFDQGYGVAGAIESWNWQFVDLQ